MNTGIRQILGAVVMTIDDLNGVVVGLGMLTRMTYMRTYIPRMTHIHD
jgi:hypothetical protein